jgi:hypothetical protein
MITKDSRSYVTRILRDHGGQASGDNADGCLSVAGEAKVRHAAPAPWEAGEVEPTARPDGQERPAARPAMLRWQPSMVMAVSTRLLAVLGGSRLRYGNSGRRWRWCDGGSGGRPGRGGGHSGNG